MRHAAAARREEGEYLHGSLTNEQDRRGGPGSATLRAKTWRTKGHVAPQSQKASAMLLRRAWPFARQAFAPLFPIYEMGSKAYKGCSYPVPPRSAISRRV